MAKTRVLIAVKTYPTISTKYDELVCTAGFLEDGSWIRIYPVQFRKKAYSQQYSAANKKAHRSFSEGEQVAPIKQMSNSFFDGLIRLEKLVA